ncbi:MAG: NAD(P)-binding protein [Verrucomicrobiales bacterium]|nr:NAD(P)-binding protein [Verrucomicrobiales bacterium]
MEYGPVVIENPTAPDLPSILIIGAGFSGICMGIQLKQAGIRDFVIYDKGRGPGGVWRDNTYPGAARDIPSSLYSYSFASTSTWSKKFPEQTEILGYLQ